MKIPELEIRICRGICCLMVLAMAGSSSAADPTIDFNRQIRPILSGRCYKCHGPDAETREAGLRLDEAAGALKPLESGEAAIVAGKPEASSLIARVVSDDEYERMPPPSEGDPLTTAEIELLKQWISQGAPYDQHWSFVSPRVAEIPSSLGGKNAVDAFVRQRLQQEGLSPSEEADRRTLIRRVSLDLTGLPPTPDDVAEFLADKSPDAYSRFVDRLLASPAYGEKWGRVWLDLARYADSAGYADDPFRVIWMYRDWVIDAINAGMPFDEFTVQQLAGDQLPSPSDDQLIATAFHRNTMTNSEGGTDDEEFRTAAIVDRVNTTMQVWMGMTMGCAQCHSHKYDPISQTEFFQVYDIFNQTEDADRRDESPTLDLLLPESRARQESLKKQITSTQTAIEDAEKKARESGDLISLPDGPIQARFVRVDLPGTKKFLSLAEVQLFSGDDNVARQGKASQSSTGYDGHPELAIDGNTDGHFFDAMSTTHTNQEDNPWWEVDLQATQRIDRVVLWNRNDSPGIGSRLNGCRIIFLDENRQPVWVHLVEMTSEQDTAVAVPAQGTDASKTEQQAFAAYVAARSPELQRLRDRKASLEKQLAGIQPVRTPIMRELPGEKHRTTRIQIRGNFLDLGEEVHAGVPSAFHDLETDSPSRLDFARWLVDPENPLTARVVVNRYWESLFGIGLVETSEDFGMQGELPSHPQLLDWLAIQLMENSWDTKQLVRTIVLSATYRQDSSVSPELASRDPRNRLLARGPRFRLSAELVRDQALAMGDLLSRKMHGPSVQPHRPKLGLSAAFGASTDWETSQGEDAYRRGVYTRWQRSLPYPSMDAFDAPSREVCTLRRIRTNTPLQALVTLNDPVYMEAARGLAGRILREGGDPIDRKLTFAFEICTSREPTSSELSVLSNLLGQAREKFQSHPEEAKKLMVLGDSGGTEPVEQAAWSIVANVLLNLDETLTRR
ncbi:MAG: DUF1553 domain-containing protein [Planctomycetaceae bacterium]|nr:DUF1553 domain-containing protein [Planctomycetaceae bacterium]